MTDLTQGNIYKTLSKLALPIMATSFIQMSYNLMDLIWLGRLSTMAVTAAGTVGFFAWLGQSLAVMPALGAQINVADAVGKRDEYKIEKYISNTLKLAFFMSIIYMVFLYVFKRPLIAFFNLNHEINSLSYQYMNIFNLMSIPMFINPVFSGISNGQGDSKTPFLINSIGLFVNMVLDPLLIFGIGPFPKWGIQGAAVATTVAQFIVLTIFIMTRREYLFFLRRRIDLRCIKESIKLGLPVSSQDCIFSVISMMMAAIIAFWGTEAVAAQKIAVQIESITWMTIGGFSMALSSFIAQNKGAKKYDRIKEGYQKAMKIVIAICFGTMILLFTLAPLLFNFFTPDDTKTIAIGVHYLRIMSVSEIFLGLEIANIGALNGLGKTLIPAINGILLTAVRVPIALWIRAKDMSLNWIWIEITLTCILKGLLLFLFFYFVYYKKNRYDELSDEVELENSYS